MPLAICYAAEFFSAKAPPKTATSQKRTLFPKFKEIVSVFLLSVFVGANFLHRTVDKAF